VESVLDENLFEHHLLQHGLEGGPNIITGCNTLMLRGCAAIHTHPAE
jgi:hypothetical protein